MKKADIVIGEIYAIRSSKYRNPAKAKIIASGTKGKHRGGIMDGHRHHRSTHGPNDSVEFEHLAIDDQRYDPAYEYEFKRKGKATIWIAPHRDVFMTWAEWESQAAARRKRDGEARTKKKADRKRFDEIKGRLKAVGIACSSNRYDFTFEMNLDQAEDVVTAFEINLIGRPGPDE